MPGGWHYRELRELESAMDALSALDYPPTADALAVVESQRELETAIAVANAQAAVDAQLAEEAPQPAAAAAAAAPAAWESRAARRANQATPWTALCLNAGAVLPYHDVVADITRSYRAVGGDPPDLESAAAAQAAAGFRAAVFTPLALPHPSPPPPPPLAERLFPNLEVPPGTVGGIQSVVLPASASQAVAFASYDALVQAHVNHVANVVASEDPERPDP